MGLRIGMWDTQFRPWGWIRLQEDEGPRVYLQYTQAGPEGQERFDMQAAVLQASDDEALSGRTWRRIPFSDLEGMLRFAEVRKILTSTDVACPPSLDALEEFFAATEDASTFQAMMTADTLVGDGADGHPRRKFPFVKAPDGRLTDEFLGDVAEAYRWLTEAKLAPAPAIAEMAEVPIRTVHRWIYEARKRGILPPARSGRAG